MELDVNAVPRKYRPGTIVSCTGQLEAEWRTYASITPAGPAPTTQT